MDDAGKFAFEITYCTLCVGSIYTTNMILSFYGIDKEIKKKNRDLEGLQLYFKNFLNLMYILFHLTGMLLLFNSCD